MNILTNPLAALKKIRANDRLFIGSGAALPEGLIECLVNNATLFNDQQIAHIATYGIAPYVQEQYQNHFRHVALFIGENTREAVNSGRADFIPINLSEVPRFFKSGRMSIDVALIQVSPSADGTKFSLGLSVDVVLAAIQSARLVIAQINPQMPYTYGDAEISSDLIHFAWTCSKPMPTGLIGDLSEAEKKVAQNVATLIDDGSTLQIGMGRTANAVALALSEKNDLGVHTEVFSDGLMRLSKNGNINNSQKSLYAGQSVCTQAYGSQELYDFIDQNPSLIFQTVDKTNDPRTIANQHKIVSINTAIEVDLTGQVVGDCIGKYFHSGVGGQFDFTRGAGLSSEGLPIVAMTATTITKEGLKVSKVVCNPAEHAGVVTARGLVHYVVTEYGIADLYGKTIEERALSMIEIAHPDHRAELLASAKERGLVSSSQPLFTIDILKRPELLHQHYTKNKTITIRPIHPSDEASMQTFFYSHSEKVIYLRYGFLKKHLHKTEVEQRACIIEGKSMALIAVEPLGNRPGSMSYGKNIRAIARYIALKDNPKAAEAALIVDDESHGLGIGTTILKRLVEAAVKDGFEQLIFEIQRKNTGMLRLFEKTFPSGEVKSLDEDSMEAIANLTT